MSLSNSTQNNQITEILATIKHPSFVVNQQDINGNTPLMNFIKHCDNELIDAILSRGDCDAYIKNNKEQDVFDVVLDGRFKKRRHGLKQLRKYFPEHPTAQGAKLIEEMRRKNIDAALILIKSGCRTNLLFLDHTALSYAMENELKPLVDQMLKAEVE